MIKINQTWGPPISGALYMERPTLAQRGELNGLQILLSRTQAGLGRVLKQEQEENTRNHLVTGVIVPNVARWLKKECTFC